jgi:hypothetical protein
VLGVEVAYPDRAHLPVTQHFPSARSPDDPSSVAKTGGGDEEAYASAAIEKLPHLLFPFGALPKTKYEEFTVEFPHEHTRNNQRLLEKLQVSRESI